MERPKTSQLVIDEFAKIIDSQDKKGFEKYQTSIDDAVDEQYDWKLMALEETADLQKYLVKRINELERILARTNQDLYEAEEENKWLKKQLLESKELIRTIKAKARFSKCMELEKANLELAQENERLKEQLASHKG